MALVLPSPFLSIVTVTGPPSIPSPVSPPASFVASSEMQTYPLGVVVTAQWFIHNQMYFSSPQVASYALHKTYNGDKSLTW